MRQPRISRLSSWKRFERKTLAVIIKALAILQSIPDVGESEPKLNRELYFCFMRTAPTHLPVPEGRNPPLQSDKPGAKREFKVPDFYWRFVDNQSHIKPTVRYFTLECKRLGKSLRASRILNEQYVQKGIRRFVTPEHGYGKGTESGAMIAYVQTMKLDDILLEVNVAIQANPESISPIPPPTEGWQVGEVSRLDHTLERPFPMSPFHLWHFWLDLRRGSAQSATKKSSQVKVVEESNG